ncbi:MAG TPA: helicase-associated domain-containing protein, partial [Chloroflexota bacterium]|nr:helicase-associated domain-containing protein [Chloroflexota bacterium]
MALSESTVLERYGVPSLQQMVKQRSGESKSQSKAALVSQLAADLFQADRIEKAVADLAPVERRLLDQLALLGGDAPTGLLYRDLLGEGLIAEPKRDGPFRSPRDQRGSPWTRGSKRFADVIARLGVLGLAFSESNLYGAAAEIGAPGWRIYIPEGILAHLPRPEIPPVVSAEPPEVVTGDVSFFPRDVYRLFGFAESAPLTLTVRGQIVKRSLVPIDGALRVSENAAAARSEEDLPRFSLLRALAEDLGLLVVRNGTLVADEEKAGAFLERGPGERLAALYRSYRDTARWCEFGFPGGPGIARRNAAGRDAPPPLIAARGRVIAELSGLPGGAWIPLAHLIDRLKRTAYEFLIPRPRIAWNEDYYYDLNPYAGENPLGWSFNGVREATGWEIVEGWLIRQVVGALHWLGLLNLGIRDGRPAEFRITAIGAQLLRGESPAITVPPPRVVVQPNYQIFAFEPIDEAVLHLLDQFAERVRTESAVEYRLSEAAVYRARQRGLSAGEILDRLERLSAVPLPQNVRRTVEEWGERHERIVVRRGVGLLRALDKTTLD